MNGVKSLSRPKSLKTTLPWVVRFFWPLAFLVALGIAVPTAYSLLGPKFAAVQGTSRQDLSVKRDAVTKARAHLAQVQTLEEKLSMMSQEEILKIEQMLPPESDQAELFTLLEDLTHDRGLAIHSVSVAPSESFPRLSSGTEIKNTTIGVWDVTLVVSGLQSYELYKQFLEDIEQNLRLYDLVSVSYTPGSEQQSFNLKTYYKKTPP
jgi:hypothetical protein